MSYLIFQMADKEKYNCERAGQEGRRSPWRLETLVFGSPNFTGFEIEYTVLAGQYEVYHCPWQIII